MSTTGATKLFSMRLPEDDRAALEDVCGKSGLGLTGQILQYCREGMDPERVSVKMPISIRQALKEAADDAFRTEEAQILFYIQEALK
jgi:hypothetical protein